jgi:hypothetical protein
MGLGPLFPVPSLNIIFISNLSLIIIVIMKLQGLSLSLTCLLRSCRVISSTVGTHDNH